MGSARISSDLDVGYYLRGYREGARLSISEELDLADALSRRLRVEVDLRDVSGAPLEVRGRVLEEGVRVYSGDEQERVDLTQLLERLRTSDLERFAKAIADFSVNSS